MVLEKKQKFETLLNEEFHGFCSINELNVKKVAPISSTSFIKAKSQKFSLV